jgi:3-phenylpropionate/trans-cinnamate dioxygenase alpha subunit
MIQWDTLVNLEKRTVSPRVFVDPDLYRLEQERVFGRCWLYVAHDSQIPQPGDFVTNYMGEEPVIVCRDGHGAVRVFINSCRHRGMRVCRVDAGNTRTFLCPYHGWTYDTQGRLVGVPQHQGGYHGELKREEWGLIEIPRVATYRGLIFASFANDIESLDSYLGDFRWYLDILLNRTAGGWMLLPGVHKWTLKGNWKLAAEQFSGDNYHATAAHESMAKLGVLDTATFGGQPWTHDIQVTTDKGHGWINLTMADSPEIAQVTEAYQAWVRTQAQQRLSPVQNELVNCIYVGNVFPNFSLISFVGFVAIRLWQPRGPDRMEVWSWGMVESDAPPEVQALARKMKILTFSPSGIFEQDDGDMWGESTEAMGGFYRRRFPLNYQMGAGRGQRDPERPGLIHSPPTELGIFNFYERWRTLMSHDVEADK